MSSRPVAALWRLRPYLRPYRFQLTAMFAAAICAEGAEIAIPLLIKAVIDGPIAHHERALLIPLGLAANVMMLMNRNTMPNPANRRMDDRSVVARDSSWPDCHSSWNPGSRRCRCA